MDAVQIAFFAVLVVGSIGFFHILIVKPITGNAAVAASLFVIFTAFTAIQIGTEGVVMFFTNHSQNLTGLQVWWDLVMAVIIALFFIAPRARAAGMNVPAWAILAGCTASIGLLAMVARLFWLESRAERSTDEGVAA